MFPDESRLAKHRRGGIDSLLTPFSLDTMNAWQRVLNHLKAKVNSHSYQTWLRPTRFSHASSDTLVVRVPNREFEEWIRR